MRTHPSAAPSADAERPRRCPAGADRAPPAAGYFSALGWVAEICATRVGPRTIGSALGLGDEVEVQPRLGAVLVVMVEHSPAHQRRDGERISPASARASSTVRGSVDTVWIGWRLRAQTFALLGIQLALDPVSRFEPVRRAERFFKSWLKPRIRRARLSMTLEVVTRGFRFKSARALRNASEARLPNPDRRSRCGRKAAAGEAKDVERAEGFISGAERDTTISQPLHRSTTSAGGRAPRPSFLNRMGRPAAGARSV